MIKTKPRRSIWFKDMGGAATVDDSNNVFGYLAGYGNVDDGRDRLHKGCCAKSIKDRGPESTTARKIAMLYHHMMHMPVGRFTKLEEKDQGLYYEGTLDEIPFVTQTLKPQLKSKTINNHSIGYNYIYDDKKLQYNEKEDVLEVFEVDLFEGSFLPLGMNENTPFGGFKKFLENTDDYGSLAESAEKLLKKMKNGGAEYELRSILMKYQSLLDSAAEEITAMRKQPKSVDYKYLLNNFKL